jgi:hypothetical protein
VLIARQEGPLGIRNYELRNYGGSADFPFRATYGARRVIAGRAASIAPSDIEAIQIPWNQPLPATTPVDGGAQRLVWIASLSLERDDLWSKRSGVIHRFAWRSVFHA